MLKITESQFNALIEHVGHFYLYPDSTGEDDMVDGDGTVCVDEKECNEKQHETEDD